MYSLPGQTSNLAKFLINPLLNLASKPTHLLDPILCFLNFHIMLPSTKILPKTDVCQSAYNKSMWVES